MENEKKLVGFQFNVKNSENGKFEYPLDDFFSWQIFETEELLHKWLNTYGYGSGYNLNKENIRIIPIYEGDIENYTFVPMLDYPDKVDEYCPHCQTDVQLDAKFEQQICPNCGKMILPCNLCDWNRCDCNNCPLKKTT